MAKPNMFKIPEVETDSSKKKAKPNMFEIPDEHYDFLVRIIVPAMKICELDNAKTDPTRETNVIRKHCHLALKEFENNDLETARVHLSRAEAILESGIADEPVRENGTEHSRENSDPPEAVLADEVKATAEDSTTSPHNSHSPIVQSSTSSHTSEAPSTSSIYKFSVLNSKESIESAIHSDNIEKKERKLLHASRIKEKVGNLISRAHVAFSAKDYGVAEQLVLKAQNLRPNEKLSLDLDTIRAARKENEARISAENCKHKAQEAMSRKEFKEAEQLLLEAAKLSPQVDVEHILTEVRNMMKEETRSCVRQSGAYTKSLKDLVDSDEAVQRWLNKAKKAYDRGNMKRAEECATRAQNIQPSRRSEELLRRAQESQVPPQTAQLVPPQTPPVPLQTPLVPPQNQRNAERRTEMQDAMRRIMAATDDYGRLGVGTRATKKEVKTAYRQLTLLVHPDKNHEPEADEVFQILKKAYDKLLKNL